MAVEHQGGVPEGAYLEYPVGTRVMTREGWPGVIEDAHEAPGSNTYYVTLDNGMGGGEYGVGEVWPLEEQKTSTVDRTAADDYPELGNILVERPPLAESVPADSYFGGKVTSIWTTAADVNSSPDHTCHCCGGAGEHSCGHECYTCDASGRVGAYNEEVCEGHHGRPDPDRADVYGDPHRAAIGKEGAALVHCSTCDVDYAIDSESEKHDHSKKADLYLPLDSSPSTAVAPRYLGDGQQGGWQDGYADATSQAMREPKSDDGDYRTGYAMGWAQGVEVAQPNGGMSMTDADELNRRLSTVDLGMPGLRTEAGLWDMITGSPDPSKNWAGPGTTYSFDWCRFRKNSHCFFSKELNEDATKQAGYPVWVPEDRGHCPRVKWVDQEHCPIGEPGPHVPNGYVQATEPWEEGGQHGGIPNATVTGSLVPPLDEFRFHVTASWSDVRKKAKRIRSEGGVRVLSNRGGQITGHVKGDTNVYETRLTSVPGKYAVAFWECGCAWAAYSWGRSAAYARFEGRMCSHALALNYEAQSRGMFGRPIKEDAKTPSWMDPSIPVKVDGDWDKNKGRYSFLVPQTLRPVEASYDDTLSEASPLSVLAAKGFKARVRSIIKTLFVRGDDIVDESGDPVDARVVLYPTYDRTLGLSLTDRRRASLRTAMPDHSEVRYWAHRDSGGTALIKGNISPHNVTFFYWDPHGAGWVEDNSWASVDIKGSKSATEISAEEAEHVKAEVGHGREGTVHTAIDLGEASRLLTAQSFANEARVSPVLKGLAAQYEGDMRGFKFRVKGHVHDPEKGFVPSGRSVQEKIERKMRSKGISAERAVKSIDDSLRYTITFSPQRYAAGVADTLSKLKSMGYNVVLGQGKNYWKPGDDYQGINIAMTTPEGNKWELQFHTPQSFSAKTRSHTLYEKFGVETDPAKRAHLWDQMVAAADKIPSPPGARDISRYVLQDAMHPAPKAASMSDDEWGLYIEAGATEEYAEHIHHQLMPDGERYPYDRPWYDRSRWGRNGPVDVDDELEKVKHHGSDDQWGLYMDLLPDEPTYDQPRFAWAGPNGGMHGTVPGVDARDAFADSMTVDDEPEEALPVTYGDEETAKAAVLRALGENDIAAVTPDGTVVPLLDHTHEEVSQAIGDAPQVAGTPGVQAAYYTEDDLREVGQQAAAEVGMTAEQVLSAESASDLLAQHNARLAAAAEGVEVSGPDPFAHLKAGPASPDVAAAAKDFLAKAGMANFSQAERSQIIEEGVGSEAANLADLDITGTHYEALERHYQAQNDMPDDTLGF